ncbi:hypothetical protein AXK61_21295 [Tsukamurella pseudospumae]|uniref:GGDEF domain-containing protein n=1 Tax=Tsukamurella pseudospumae TaxID=239498 RepID=A0A137ZHU1_9ACTN|nr:hypothetical protein AXK61_21295 [Tsukamurella pseudospumae]
MAEPTGGRAGLWSAIVRSWHAGPDYRARIDYLASRRLLRGFRFAVALPALSLGAAAGALALADHTGGAPAASIRVLGVVVGLYWCIRWLVGPPPSMPVASVFVLTCGLTIVLVSATHPNAAAGAISAMAMILTATFAACLLSLTVCLAHTVIAAMAIVFFAPRLSAEMGMLAAITSIGVFAVVTIALPVVIYFGLTLMSQDAVDADTDDLCGTLNRRGFYRVAAARLGRHQRRGDATAVVGLLMIDHDGFKSINDLFGHIAGDAALLATAEIVRFETEGMEAYTARLGGDEFAVLTFCARQENVSDLAERIRHRAEVSAATSGAARGCTVSIGVSLESVASAALAPLVRSADAAMYRAKFTGNAVVVSGASESEAASIDR